MDPSAEARLAERLMARDAGALREAIEAYGGVVYGMAKRVVADPNLAEEVAQDTFLALWRRPGAFDPARGRLQSFLVGVARNKAVDLVRREASRRRHLEALLGEAESGWEVTRPDDALEAVDDKAQVKEALARLSRVQREAVVLAYFGGRTYREVAAELGVPEGTAKTRLRDGLVKLRELMADHEA